MGISRPVTGFGRPLVNLHFARIRVLRITLITVRFAGLFVGMLFISDVVLHRLCRAGLFALAGVMGVIDVDPLVLSLAQSASTLTPAALAAGAIAIAAASNNLSKGIYAYVFADRRTGTQGLALLTALALLGVLPLIFV